MKVMMKPSSMARALITLLLVSFAATATLADEPALDARKKRQNEQAFEQVWTTIRDRHWDPKMLNALNWQVIHDELRPRMQRSRTAAEARQVLRDMLARLHESHFNIIPSEVAPDVGRQGDGVPGFEVRALDEGVFVFRVLEGLPAAQLGVRPGWELKQIGDEPVAPLVARLRTTYQNVSSLGHQIVRAVKQRLHGPVGDKVAVIFRDERGQDRQLSIPLAVPKGTAATYGHLPRIYVRYETRILPPHIAYFALNSFFDPETIMQAFGDFIEQHLQADGFILDLRGNPGGIGAMAMGIGGWFVASENQRLGTMTTRESTLNFVLNPRSDTFAGPLAILVDDCSASTAEILAGGLQGLGRARVFGKQTAGAALPSRIVLLPNGDGFQFAFADYTSVDGKRLEGKGVRPDVEVPLDRKVLLAGRDPALEAAAAWIRLKKKP
jgi:carboxyl-terminal processing protease